MLDVLRNSNSRILNNCQHLSCLFFIADVDCHSTICFVKLNRILEQVVQDLTVKLPLNEEVDWHACCLRDLKVNVALLDNHLEWLDDICDYFVQFRPRTRLIVDLIALVLDLHLTQLGLNVEFEELARTPDNLHVLFNFFVQRVGVHHHLRHV